MDTSRKYFLYHLWPLTSLTGHILVSCSVCFCSWRSHGVCHDTHLCQWTLSLFLFLFFATGVHSPQATCRWFQACATLADGPHFILSPLIIYLCVHMCMQGFNDKHQESVSFCDLGPRDQTQLIRFGAKLVYPLRHLANPRPIFSDQAFLSWLPCAPYPMSPLVVQWFESQAFDFLLCLL